MPRMTSDASPCVGGGEFQIVPSLSPSSSGAVDRDLVDRVLQLEMTHVVRNELVAQVPQRHDDQQTKQTTQAALAG